MGASIQGPIRNIKTAIVLITLLIYKPIIPNLIKKSLMVAHFESTGLISQFRKEIEWFESNPEVKSIIILSCAENNYQPEDINPIICHTGKPLIGGLFPGIIYIKINMKRGA
ncbi:MAG: hypothetical protein HC830_10410 [Bacteroidetes bacterium]|nr:hypothetical protein [Bacteroidota bacterium]